MTGHSNLTDADKRFVLAEKARRTVEARQGTDRPGSDWGTTYMGIPEYSGTQGRSLIYASEDGARFRVMTFAGDQKPVRDAEYKTLDAAFRNGKKFAGADETA